MASEIIETDYTRPCQYCRTIDGDRSPAPCFACGGLGEVCRFCGQPADVCDGLCAGAISMEEPSNGTQRIETGR